MHKTYYLPTAAALAVAFFTPVDCRASRRRTEEILAVEYLNYGVIGGVQITSFSRFPLSILSVLINNEFRPSLHAPREKTHGAYLRKGLPRLLSGYGTSFITITDAPAAPDPIRALCYGKPITEVAISTDRGDFTFKIDGITSRTVMEPLKTPTRFQADAPPPA